MAEDYSQFHVNAAQMSAQFAESRATRLSAALTTIIDALDAGYEPRAIRAIAERALYNL